MYSMISFRHITLYSHHRRLLGFPQGIPRHDCVGARVLRAHTQNVNRHVAEVTVCLSSVCCRHGFTVEKPLNLQARVVLRFHSGFKVGVLPFYDFVRAF